MAVVMARSGTMRFEVCRLVGAWLVAWLVLGWFLGWLLGQLLGCLAGQPAGWLVSEVLV